MSDNESLTKSIAKAVARSYTPFATPSSVPSTTNTDVSSTIPSNNSSSSSTSSTPVTTANAVQTTIDRIIHKDTVPLLERPIVPASDTRYAQHRCHPRLQVSTETCIPIN